MPPVQDAKKNDTYVVGHNSYGQLGQDHKHKVVKFEPSLLKVPVAVVSCGGLHTVVVRGDDRSLLVAGCNAQGQLGRGHTNNVRKFVPVPGIEGVREVSCGSRHTVVVRGDDRSLLVAGYNYYGQLGLGHTNNVSKFVPVPGIEGVRGVSCGDEFSVVVLGGGSLLVAGYNGCGQLGLGRTDRVSKFVPVPGIDDVRGVGCGAFHTVVVRGGGSLLVAGFNDEGQLGLGGDAPEVVSYFRPVPGIDDVRGVSCGSWHTVVLRGDDRSLLVAGYNAYGQLGLGHTYDDVEKFVPVPGIEDVQGVSCGSNHTVVVLGGGSLLGAGHNHVGQLGLGHTNDVEKFAVVPDIGDAWEVSCGSSHMVAMTRICPHCGKTGKKTKLPLTTIMEFVCVVNKDDYTETSSISVLPIELIQTILDIYNSLCNNCYKNY